MINWKYHSPFQRIGVFEPLLFRVSKYRSRITFFLLILGIIVLLGVIFQHRVLPLEGIGLIVYKFHDNIYLPFKGYLWNQIYPENTWFFFLLLVIAMVMISRLIMGYSLISWGQRIIILWAIKKSYGHQVIRLWSKAVGGLYLWQVALGLVSGLMIIIFSLIQLWYWIIGESQIFSLLMIALSIFIFFSIFLFGYFKYRHSTLNIFGVTSILEIINREMLRVWCDIFNFFKRDNAKIDSNLRYSWAISKLEHYILSSVSSKPSVETITILFKSWVRVLYIIEKYSLSDSFDLVNTIGEILLDRTNELRNHIILNKTDSQNDDIWISSIEDMEAIIKYVLYLNKDFYKEPIESYDLSLYQNLVKVSCNTEKRLQLLDLFRTQIELGLRRANSRIRTTRKQNTQFDLWENSYLGSLAVLVSIALSVVTKVEEYGRSYVDAIDALRLYTDFKDNFSLSKNSSDLLTSSLSKCSSVAVEPIEYRILSELASNLSEIKRLKTLGIEGISILSEDEELDLFHNLSLRESWAGLKI